ncbi:MAG: HD-GYP domain-containing protein [Anaeromicrobium sp.]|jgi:HD-GYP domain-containing protein (c-di-GMP phosphodiesterase class II)|uniref:HD-GYP domain-containing protein n=1 Tax=Anaeromicrobium sp. TaxID=1929132 RepID=UPI0025E917AE|nr:HD-GYP domain-containing protein [Anaeromicrobium sp.]MCT4594758.1 HD-GYP domain-containing protein [Anaeromicrobium sp.]
MRFVPTLCLREGMIVGKKLYGNNEQVLIAEKTELKQTYIDKIKLLGFSGVYVEDNISKDIHIETMINEDLRIKAVKGIKELFVASEKGSKFSTPKIDKAKLMVESIIRNILENKNLMVNMIDLKTFDDYTFYHSVNVAVLSIVIGVALDLNKNELYKLGLGALMHDIGKVFIEKEILNKKGKLTDNEYVQVKGHSELGYRYLKENFDIPITSYVSALQHHERFDGNGYPDGKSGKNISLFGRIISITDVYDALTSDRPYRKALLPSDAIEYIMANSGSMFDPDLVKIFVRKIAPYPIGTCVRLSNNIRAIVVDNYEYFVMRPKLKILTDENKNPVEPYYIDLKNDKNSMNITIVDIVDM